MSEVLARICADKRAHIAARKAVAPFADVDRAARAASPVRGFENALRKAVKQQRYGLIAEIKRASPSQGEIRPDFDPPALARAYQDGGAACLSVLTDQPYFKGQDIDLINARAACALPVLRKDFMLRPYQIAEARALGADCVLLIMAALDDSQAQELLDAAHSYGMDVLIEVHDRPELDRALELPSNLIGINNRNLKTLHVDLHTTETLAPFAPPNRLLVSESGLRTSDDLARMAKVGARCFLIGESFMRQPDVAAAVKTLLAQ
ncbi:Indole-3-glycerol phosphate synthase [Azospirillaceae bacterium]